MMTFRTLTIRHATDDDVDYVVRRMREEERREIYGARFAHDAESLIAELIASRRLSPFFYAVARTAHVRPVALVGVMLVGPGHAHAQMIATPDVRLIVADFTRFVRERFIPDCIRSGLLRVELRTLASWVQNRRWLEALGAEFECECRGMGQEPYAQYAWVREGEPSCA